MTCYHPLKGFLKPDGGWTANRGQGYLDRPFTVPCGRCTGCRIDRSIEWAIRCSHEASLYESNVFLTLTYDNEHLPMDGSLNVVHFQQFMKRLRKSYGEGVRYYHCGEYGGKTNRPHYHAIVFNINFDDKKLHKRQNGHDYYVSEKLNSLWKWGFCIIGEATFQSAGYCARYIMKKDIQKKSAENYGYKELLCSETGEIRLVAPEYTTMSRGDGENTHGLGHEWIKRYWKDVYPRDFVVVNGRKYRPPTYYDRWLERNEPSVFLQVKRQRISNGLEHRWNQTAERLAVREFIRESRLTRLVRDLE